jgi:hypothetical protein
MKNWIAEIIGLAGDAVSCANNSTSPPTSPSALDLNVRLAELPFPIFAKIKVRQ